MVKQSTRSAMGLDGPPQLRVVPPPINNDLLIWNEDVPPAKNYIALGARLAAGGDLFRKPDYGSGVILLLPGGTPRQITKGTDLAPIIVDRVPVQIIRGGKTRGSMIPAKHLSAMLQAESFLQQFPPVDHVTAIPLYRPDFTLAQPGFNDGGAGDRILYLGDTPQVSDSMETITRFLDVMAFDTPADRTNAVAAALTVMLRNHWPGGKPILLATATKSHAGKDTVLAFATGIAKSVSVSYQSQDWPVERAIVGALKTQFDAAMVVIENARLDHRERRIASAFLERLATDPEPFLFSTGTGTPMRITNNLVLAISTNFGLVSEDIMNRSLPIHLRPVGDVANRRSPVGNPKHEFLPANKERIAAELRGMIERWKAAGKPLDNDVRHPFSVWASVVGGILHVSGFKDFLANYGQRKTADDPVRHGLGILGSARPDEWLRPSEWATLALELGVSKVVIPEADRDNNTSRARGMGIVLSAHDQESFQVETDAERLTLRLDHRRKRWEGSEPQCRYRFEVVERHPLT